MVLGNLTPRLTQSLRQPDSGFVVQLVAEGSLQTNTAVAAMKAEIETMGKVLEANESLLQKLQSIDASHTANERQLRHNLQEDARQALGKSSVL